MRYSDSSRVFPWLTYSVNGSFAPTPNLMYVPPDKAIFCKGCPSLDVIPEITGYAIFCERSKLLV